MVEATGAPAATAPPPPTLLSLCLDAVAASLTSDSAGRPGWPGGCSNDGLVGFTDEGGGEEEEEEHLTPEQVAEALPWELLHQLAARLPPVALESLHHAAQARCCFSADTNAGLGGPDGNKHGMKRSRCLDAAAESALLPSFCGSIIELTIPAKIRSFIYNSEGVSLQQSRLSYQCSKFGCYARSLRLQSVLCSPETYDLFQHCKVEKLTFIRIISENEISGWLSTIDKTSTYLALESDISMQSLSVLNLRGNNLQKGDIEDLRKILVKIPKLRELDISGNPIMDDGIRSLIPFISWATEKENPLLRLRLENCDLSSIGVSKLLECLTSAKQPLDMLSLADNPLGSSVAGALAKFLGSHVRDINFEDIGLGTLGFQTLEEALPMNVALTHINISKNRGGIKTAYFISRLILQAPNLVSVNAAANLLPPESLEVICNTLKQRTCNLERVDLTGNMHLSSANFPAFLEFKKHGKPILVVPSHLSTSVPYDDDP
ncbi:hypothetical protein EJB05_02877 [Eragrostis curvula]|uniref:F-box domain-containing protein n=1 Tax=Eragrostis curvula TaxID=38414 RepID=A0A5J9WUF1_9POAL|nr:hypothetical protein EJB05_02877 [Eragrostis curvula]